MGKRIVSLAFVLLFACVRSEPAVLLNAPPELDGARVYVDARYVGDLTTTYSYRWGVFAQSREMAAPPRYEANLAIVRLAKGVHRLRIVKAGYAEYRAVFRNGTAHVEVFVPDEAAQRSRG